MVLEEQTGVGREGAHLISALPGARIEASIVVPVFNTRTVPP